MVVKISILRGEIIAISLRVNRKVGDCYPHNLLTKYGRVEVVVFGSIYPNELLGNYLVDHIRACDSIRNGF